MASFASWWTNSETATPQGIAQAAKDAGVFLESGEYKVDALDFGDGDRPVDVLAQGTVVAAANGTSWLVYPAASREEGWRARRVNHRSGGAEVAVSQPCQIGTAYDQAARIVAALVTEAGSNSLPYKMATR